MIISNLVDFIFSRSRSSLILVAIVNTIADIDYAILRLHKLEGVVIVRLDFLKHTYYNQILLFFSTEPSVLNHSTLEFQDFSKKEPGS